VVGSGATAATLVPALASDGGTHVTMLQRTPTWFIASPRRDRVARMLFALLPARRAAALVRARNLRVSAWFYRRARRAPGKVGAWLKARAMRALGPAWDEAAFSPPMARGSNGCAWCPTATCSPRSARAAPAW
jgi:cation diffusion facilitator CzcD-associated flavoprotein CzcO